jgi:prolyl-tRNA synthetase
VEQVTQFFGVEATRLVKTILYRCDDRPVAILIRGDREINEGKVRRILGCQRLDMATAEEILDLTGGPVGFSGPVGLEGVEMIADVSLQGLANFVVGANQDQHHLINANFPRDFHVQRFEDLHMSQAGDLCLTCQQPLISKRGIEVGQIFKLGSKYSSSLKATFLNEQGREHPFIMGCYGIGITRTVAAAIEQYHDEEGIIWPMTIAPYQVLILPLNVAHEQTMDTAEQIYAELARAGVEVLLDDRDERAGFKFKDADLIGIPVRLTVGEKSLQEGMLELKCRDQREIHRVNRQEAVARAREIVSAKCIDIEKAVKKI